MIFVFFIPLFIWFGQWVTIKKRIGEFLRLVPESKFVDSEFNIIVNVDENLGSYWSVIANNDRKRWFAKEVHLRHWFGVKILDDEQLEKLRTAKKSVKTFSSIYNYDPLSDSDYRFCDSLHYQTMAKKWNKELKTRAQISSRRRFTSVSGEDRIQGAYGHC